MNIVVSEQKPLPGLANFVQSYWFGKFNTEGKKDFSQTVVPNGCIELIIHLSDDHCFLNKKNKDWNKSPEFTLLGLYTQSYTVKFSNTVNVMGVRFFPDGIRNIFGLPPAVFLSTFEDGTDLFDRSFREFCIRLREMQDPAEQVNLANEYILSQLSLHHLANDYTHTAMSLIRRAGGIASYDSLTSEIPVGNRQLQREFKIQYGITIRDYMRLARLNAVQRYMRAGNMNLTGLSYEMLFSDQSHFIREFKNYVGLPPRSFLKNREKFIVNGA